MKILNLDGEVIHTFQGVLAFAQLSGLPLRKANFAYVNLTGADLSHSDLRGACFIGADLSRVNLSRAFLSDADLSSACLHGADLVGTRDVIALGAPGGWHGHAWLREGVLSIRIGCREFRYREAVKHWRGRSDRLEQQCATEYARQIALSRGWKV